MYISCPTLIPSNGASRGSALSCRYARQRSTPPWLMSLLVKSAIVCIKAEMIISSYPIIHRGTFRI